MGEAPRIDGNRGEGGKKKIGKVISLPFKWKMFSTH